MHLNRAKHPFVLLCLPHNAPVLWHLATVRDS